MKKMVDKESKPRLTLTCKSLQTIELVGNFLIFETNLVKDICIEFLTTSKLLKNCV